MPDFSMVKCPACNRRLKIASSEPGIKVACPACHAPFTLGSRAGSGQDFLAFEIFDTEIALDDIPVQVDDGPAAPAPVGRLIKPVAKGAPPIPTAKSNVPVAVVKPPQPGPLLKAGDTEHPIGEAAATKPPKRKRRDDDPDYEDEDLADMLGVKNWGEPRYRQGWNMVYWGLTLVLFSLLLYVAGTALAFVSLMLLAGSPDMSALGMLGIAFMLVVMTDFLRLAGYGMCLGVPGDTSAKNYVWIAIGMSVASMLGGVFRVIVSFMEPFLAAHIVGAVSFAVGFMSFISFLMFMETVADMNNERGIADSVSAVIKLAGMLGVTFGIGMGIQVGAAYWVASGTAPRWLRPESGDTSVYVVAAVGSCYVAFVGILGLVTFVKFIFAILNVRRVVQENI